ncbi:hypothetical protein MMC07_001928 [Pseudocyphellaria aurata]|nr:hypothetical protein [Pseudocyphellaria aurata]
MAPPDRDWKALGISACSHQSPADRYPHKGDVRAPGVAWYRNNLTALSQCRNLFFAAYYDQIYVYKPEFPSQKISGKAELIIDLPTTNPNRIGYIHPGKPHSVNQLVISDLGHEEVIAVTCDDGDVVAYTTRSIHDALERNTLNEPSLQPTRIRTILLRNVGESAWGIAIHKAARLIAVSSNKHNITVFAFALCRESSPDALHEVNEGDVLPEVDIGFELDEWVRPFKYSETLLRRSTRNFVIVLEGHAYNIPNIAFCNTDADPTGRYLVSTDIGGVTFVWDIWQRSVLADISAYERRGFNHAGWGVACLDPRSCRLSSSILETFGCRAVSYRYGTDDTLGTPGAVYDNTASRNAVPDSSMFHPTFQVTSNVPGPAGVAAVFAQSLESDDDNTDEDDESGEPEIMAPNTTTIQDESPVLAGMISTQPTPARVDEALFGLPGRKTSIPLNKNQISTLPFHVFQTGKSDIRLMSDIKHGPIIEHGTSCNTLVCQQVLHQKISSHLRHPAMERLNMVLQIPELGIMAVAYQAGRVALLTMTKREKNGQFGFRPEWLLPFRAQELARIRPMAALLGMAIGPVQGCGRLSGSAAGESRDPKVLVNGTRRFRLILTYYDHTILTYEIWRSIADSGSGIQDRILVL